MILPWLIGQVFEPIEPQTFPLILMGDLLLSLVAAVILIMLSTRIARKAILGEAWLPV